MTLPGALRPWTGATPVSMTATSMPLPVYPALHHACAPRYAVVAEAEFGSVAGSYVPAPQLAPAKRPANANTTGRTASLAVRRRRGDRCVVELTFNPISLPR